MTALVGVMLLAAVIGALVAIHARGILRHWMRGRHVSKPLKRRLGQRAYVLRIALPCPGAVLTFWSWVPCDLVLLALLVWALDDLLFPEDDDRRRRHEWSRVRLRMPRPVRLRPIERWPVTA